MADHAKNAKALADEIEGIWAAAERAGRDLTQGEREHMEGLLEAAKSQHSIEQQIKGIGGPFAGLMNGAASSVMTDPNYSNTAGGSPGEVFVQSDGYKAIKDAGARGQTWTSGAVDCGPLT